MKKSGLYILVSVLVIAILFSSFIYAANLSLPKPPASPTASGVNTPVANGSSTPTNINTNTPARGTGTPANNSAKNNSSFTEISWFAISVVFIILAILIGIITYVSIKYSNKNKATNKQ